jgi:hypothetical protein
MPKDFVFVFGDSDEPPVHVEMVAFNVKQLLMARNKLREGFKDDGAYEAEVEVEDGVVYIDVAGEGNEVKLHIAVRPGKSHYADFVVENEL